MKLRLLPLALTVLTLAACGEGSKNSPSTAPNEAATADGGSANAAETLQDATDTSECVGPRDPKAKLEGSWYLIQKSAHSAVLTEMTITKSSVKLTNTCVNGGLMSVATTTATATYTESQLYIKEENQSSSGICGVFLPQTTLTYEFVGKCFKGTNPEGLSSLLVRKKPKI